MKLRPMTDKEHARMLHYIINWTDPSFMVMWNNCGRMVFSDEYGTIALEIVDGKFRINANPRYWKRISKYQRTFLICHEFLHVMLGHWLSPAKSVDGEWLNIAQDIQVNEHIAMAYPILMYKMKGRDGMAWIHTVFKDKAHLVEKNKDCWYYYELLMKCLR